MLLQPKPVLVVLLPDQLIGAAVSCWCLHSDLCASCVVTCDLYLFLSGAHCEEFLGGSCFFVYVTTLHQLHALHSTENEADF